MAAKKAHPFGSLKQNSSGFSCFGLLSKSKPLSSRSATEGKTGLGGHVSKKKGGTRTQAVTLNIPPPIFRCRKDREEPGGTNART